MQYDTVYRTINEMGQELYYQMYILIRSNTPIICIYKHAKRPAHSLAGICLKNSLVSKLLFESKGSCAIRRPIVSTTYRFDDLSYFLSFQVDFDVSHLFLKSIPSDDPTR